MEQFDEIVRAYALRNAIDFGEADAAKVLPKLFSYGLEKKDIGKSMPKIQKIVKEVNALSAEERENEFAELKGFIKEKEVKEKKLPSLPGAVKGNVVTRIPPEPSKYLHLGHALSFLINYTYAKDHEGKCFIRLDDANPEKVSQEYVDIILEDLQEYLQIKSDGVSYVSDDMEELYSYALVLIEKGAAYMCFCDREKMQNLRHEGKECACRKHTLIENKEFWSEFIKGTYKEGEAVLRFKGDMQSNNHVMRDSALFRIVLANHFRHEAKYKAWPMYDFYTPIEDSLMGMTHILRSMEFDTRVELHDQIKKFLGLKQQTVVQYGRFNVIGAETQGREIRAKIESGEYTGIDDPRLMTLRALRRRGIRREVFLELMNHIGLSKKQIQIDFAMIASISRKILDKQVNRYYFVAQPVKLQVQEMPLDVKKVEVKAHPDKDELRTLNVGKSIFISKSDHDKYKGEEIRLMNLFNIKLGSKTTFTGSDNKRIQKIQWVSEGLPVKVRMDDGSWVEGLAEENIQCLKVDDLVQFERFGFVRLDKKPSKSEKNGVYEFWFAHA